jgi:hypothetical protein
MGLLWSDEAHEQNDVARIQKLLRGYKLFALELCSEILRPNSATFFTRQRIVRGFPQYLWANAYKMPSNWRRSPRTKSLPTHHSWLSIRLILRYTTSAIEKLLKYCICACIGRTFLTRIYPPKLGAAYILNIMSFLRLSPRRRYCML